MRHFLRFVCRSFVAFGLLSLLACGRGASIFGVVGGPSNDASTPPLPGALDSGIQTRDSGIQAIPDAAADEDAGPFDAAPPNPIAPCMSADRDVFYVNAASAGVFERGAETLTNLGATWAVFTAPLNIMAGAASFELTFVDGGPPVPGHYVLGANGPLYGGVAEDGDECSLSSGTLDIVDYATYVTDAGTTELSSVLLDYSIECDSVPVQGCVKYALGPVDLTPPDAGAEDGGVLAPCQGGDYVFYVSNEGTDAGLPSPIAVTGASGTWGVSGEGDFQFNVTDTNMAPWALVLGTVPGASWAVGTYTSSGTDLEGSWIQVEADGIGCGGPVPTGTFTIAALEMPQDQLKKILVGFDLACENLGTVTGCFSYGQ